MKVYISVLFGLCFMPCLLAQTTQCGFIGEDHGVLPYAKERLAAIEKQIDRISIPDPEHEPEYIYNIGVCKPATEDLPKESLAGVTQFITDSRKIKVIGRLNSSAVIAGKDWVFLEYFDGDQYHSHCNGGRRSAKIMFTCSPGKLQPYGRVVEENANKSSDCYYLFEVETDAACPPNESHKLGPGSVICIVFLVLVGVYLIGGALYQRVIVGAKGMEQIPHYTFWQDFGNLQADGCDLICRSGGQTRGSREYRGIGDDQIHPSHDEEVSHDDSLLPM